MEGIPHGILFAVTLAAFLWSGLVRTYYSKHVSDSISGYHLFNAASSLVCGLTLLALSGGDFRSSAYTVLMALLFGVITAVQQIANSAALSIGPWSYTSVIISMSTVITALSGVMFFGEQLKATQMIGIVLMVCCLVLSVKKDEEEKKKSMRWFLLSLAACIGCGGIGIMQKIHQTSSHRQELTMFLIIAFICSFVFSAVNLLMGKLRGKEKDQPMFIRKASPALLGGVFVAAGVGVALNNLINLYLSGVVDSAVFFPIVNGGGLILITAASVVCFREKLAVRQWTGLGLGIAATLLLCM